MKRRSFDTTLFAALACGPLLLAACADTDTSAETGGRVAISVASVTLPNVKDACYTLAVHTDAGDLVWSKPHVCSSQYGDASGAITYIAPCATADDDTAAGTPNTVTLTLENLYSQTADHADLTRGSVPGDAWDNPCGAFFDGSPVDPDGTDTPSPCQLSFDCRDDADASVEFDLTIARDADHGFFDTAP